LAYLQIIIFSKVIYNIFLLCFSCAEGKSHRLGFEILPDPKTI
jgi:hypothetical protein